MRARHAVAVIVVLFGGTSPVSAAYVTYTFSGTATGQYEGQTFMNDPFSFVITSDTSTVTPFSYMNNGTLNNGFLTGPSTAVFNLNAPFPFFFFPSTLIAPVQVFDDTTTGVVGFQYTTNPDPFLNAFLLALQAAPFDTYNLQSSIGPVNVSSAFASNVNDVQGSLGAIYLFSESNLSFTASVVPEPASVMMLGTGMLGVIGIGASARRRSRRRVLMD